MNDKKSRAESFWICRRLYHDEYVLFLSSYTELWTYTCIWEIILGGGGQIAHENGESKWDMSVISTR
jgi:hypothetical protein